MDKNVFSWLFFLVVIVISLAIDLGSHRKQTATKVSSALLWSAFWIALALLFNVWIYFQRGTEDALNFLAGYLVEKALSVDNLFVFLIIFKAFQIPHSLRYKVLFWGIVGAFVLRGIFITLGVALISTFHWVLYLFGIFLIYTGCKLALHKDLVIKPEKNPIVLWFQKWLPVTTSTKSGNFFVRVQDSLTATPLFLALVAVTVCDIIFAVDSIPAILGITTDPFIVYSSNIFAILGLRSLYFALQGMIDLFHHLHYGLALILVFIGLKMLLADFIYIPITISLGFIFITLLLSMAASIIYPKKL